MKSLDAYLRRIGVSATLKADLATLRLIMTLTTKMIIQHGHDALHPDASPMVLAWCCAS